MTPFGAGVLFIVMLIAGIAIEARVLRKQRNRRTGLPEPSAQSIAGESWREHTPPPGRYPDV